MSRFLTLTFAALTVLTLGGCAQSTSQASESSASAVDNASAIDDLASQVDDLESQAGDLSDRVDDISPSSSLDDDAIEEYLNEVGDIEDELGSLQSEVDNAASDADDLAGSLDGDDEGNLDDVVSAIEDIGTHIDEFESDLEGKTQALRVENLFRVRSKYFRSLAKSKVADAYVEAFDACTRGLKGATGDVYRDLSRKCIDYFGHDAQKAAVAEFDKPGGSSGVLSVGAPVTPPPSTDATSDAKSSTIDCTDFDMAGVDGAPGAGYFDISVRNMQCSEAKRIILENAGGNSFAGAKAEGFDCISMGAKGETYQFRCASAGDAKAFRYWFGS